MLMEKRPSQIKRILKTTTFLIPEFQYSQRHWSQTSRNLNKAQLLSCCLQQQLHIMELTDYFDTYKINALLDRILQLQQSQAFRQKNKCLQNIIDLPHPEKIRQLMNKINKRMMRSSITENSEKIIGKPEYHNWTIREYKFFKIIVEFYCIQISTQVSKLVNPNVIQSQQDVKEIQEMFKNKLPIIIDYQLAVLSNERDGKARKWTQQESIMLTSVCEYIMRLFRKSNEPNWKEKAIDLYQISEKKYFRLFTECRQQWNNHLNPTIKKMKWTIEEDIELLHLVEKQGFKWALISRQMKGGRNEHMVKNRYNSFVRKLNTKFRRHSWKQEVKRILVKLLKKHGHLQQSSEGQISAGNMMNSTEERSTTQLISFKPEEPKEVNKTSISSSSSYLDQFSIEKYLSLEEN